VSLLIRRLTSSRSTVSPLIALPVRRTRTHCTIGKDPPAFQATRAVPSVPAIEKLVDGWSWMTETAPGRLSDAASWPARSRQEELAWHPVMSPMTAAESPLASSFTSAVMADCSALLALNTRARSALIARNATTAAAIAMT
jgi:hypothetical protein